MSSRGYSYYVQGRHGRNHTQRIQEEYPGYRTINSPERNQSFNNFEPRAPVSGYYDQNFGRRDTGLYGRARGDNRNITGSIRSIPRNSTQSNYRRDRSNYSTQRSTGRTGGNFRQNTPARNQPPKSGRQRKRYLNAGKRRTKRSRSNKKGWSEISKTPKERTTLRLVPATLILVSGIPGKAAKHKFLAVKFQTHPFFRPRVSVNKKGESINFEIVKINKYSSGAERHGCEFSIVQQDIASIVAFVGDKIPEDITKKKIDPTPEVMDITEDKVEVKKHHDIEGDIDPDTMTGGQLRIELKKRKLESRGLKAELIRRLKMALAQDDKDSSMVADTIDSTSEKAEIVFHIEEEDESEDVECTPKNPDGFIAADDPHSKVRETPIVSVTSESLFVDEIQEIDTTTKNGEEKDAPIITEDQGLKEKWEIEEESSEENGEKVAEETFGVVTKVLDENQQAEELSNPIEEVADDEESEQHSEQEEFLLEDCYAYASGFRGKIGKKALMKTFGEFGTIIEMKQISKICRIQYNTPAAVEKLIKFVPPLKFNGKFIKISRTLNLQVSTTKDLTDKEAEEVPTEGEINLAGQKNFAADMEEEQDSEDEVETGRGGSEAPKSKKKTSWKKNAKKSSWKRASKWKSKKAGKKWRAKKWRAKKWRGKKVKHVKKTKDNSSHKNEQVEEEDEIEKNDSSDKSEQVEQEDEIENVKESIIEKKTEKIEKVQQDDIEESEMKSDMEDDVEPDLSGTKEKTTESEDPEEELEKVEEHETKGKRFNEPTTIELPEDKDMMADCVDKPEKLEEPERVIDIKNDSPVPTEVPEVDSASDNEENKPEHHEMPSEVKTNASEAVDIDSDKSEIIHDSENEDHSSESRGVAEVDALPKDGNENTFLEEVDAPISTLTDKMKIDNEEEQSDFKKNIGLRSEVSLLDDLESDSIKQENPEKLLKALVKSKELPKSKAKAGEGNQVDENNIPNRDDEFRKSETKSYRVVIALKKGARLLHHSENLLRVEDLNNARVFILEFAITSKNQTPKDIFASAMEGPLKDVAHGEVWPETGPLSFKHTLTKVLSEMQVAREKERRAYGPEALFQENVELKKKRRGFEVNIKSLKEEANCLRKRIRTAINHLKERDI